MEVDVGDIVLYVHRMTLASVPRIVTKVHDQELGIIDIALAPRSGERGKPIERVSYDGSEKPAFNTWYKPKTVSLTTIA